MTQYRVYICAPDIISSDSNSSYTWQTASNITDHSVQEQSSGQSPPTIPPTFPELTYDGSTSLYRNALPLTEERVREDTLEGEAIQENDDPKIRYVDASTRLGMLLLVNHERFSDYF